MKNNVCVYPFIHYPMCSFKISCNLLNFPLLRTNHNEHKPSESPFRFSICSVGFFLSISCSDLIICDYTKPSTNIHTQKYKKLMRYILILHAFWRDRPSFSVASVSIIVFYTFSFPYIFALFWLNIYLIILGLGHVRDCCCFIFFFLISIATLRKSKRNARWI